MSSPEEIIKRIRKIRFGIGLDTSNLTSDQMDALRDKKRVLEDAASLAKEINTKKPHFILELIQNAEDNYYEDKVTPRLKFIIRHNDLIVQNNERGFEEANVRALCGIGETTKKNRSLGYIGEKGIGFKSVFMVTDEPHIYSQGFQFRFKYKKDNPISILIPHWIDKPPGYIDRSCTNVILPIRSEEKDEIYACVNHIQPTLLLFLRKLRSIQVEDRVLGKSQKIERHDSNGIVEIRHGTKKSYWRIVRKLVAVPNHIDEERRKDIHETEILLAFPLANDGSARTNEKQHVFAFLPIRKYGFGFIVQADFLLSIGREDIIKDNNWNKWLRLSFVSVFLDAIERFKAEKKLKHTFYNYIPVEEDVEDDFFVQVVEQTHKELQNTECLLTESNQWRKPSDVLMADDDMRKLVTNNDSQRFFNKDLLSKRVKAKKNILERLKVDEFLVGRLLVCLRNHDWTEKHDNKWFARLYYYLSRQELTDQQIDLLKELNIVKLENGQLTSANEGLIFFPFSRRGREYGFEHELRVIKRSILESVRKLEKQDETSRVRDFFKKLDIRSPRPDEIIENHILPTYEDYNWKKKDPKTLLGYVQYVKDNLKDYEERSDEDRGDPLERLKESLFIRIKKRGEKEHEHLDNIYLSEDYGSKNDLETLFRSIDVNFLHPCYIDDVLREYEKKTRALKREIEERSRKLKKKRGEAIKGIKEKLRKAEKIRNEKIGKWRRFFLRLGASDLLIVRKDPETEYYEGMNYADNKVTKKQISKEEKEETIWNDCEWKKTDWRGYYICDDWKSEDFDKFLQRLEELPKNDQTNLCTKLISLLDKNWNKFRKARHCQYYHRYSGQQGWWPGETPSTFLMTLRKATWCPTTEKTLAKPSRAFLDKSNIRDILGDSVSYLAIHIKNEGFIKDLGLNTQANVNGVLNYLRTSAGQGDLKKDDFKKIYSFLNKHFNDEDGIRRSFSIHPLIYVPNNKKKFFTSQEVLWKDLTDVFGENRAYLEKHYPELKDFFVEKLRITEKPSPKEYADVLVDLGKKEQIKEEDIPLVLKIYRELDYHLNPKNVDRSIAEDDWWDEFIRKSIFLTERRDFWRNDGDIFINDNKELHDLFRDKEGVAFLFLPKGFHPDKIRFLVRAARVRYLSSAIEITPIFAEASCSEHTELTNQIRDLIPYALRYLYWKENPEYEELKNSGFFEKVSDLTVYSVDELQVNYKVKISQWKSISAITGRRCILHQGRLYISKEIENRDYVALEFSKIFGEIKGLDSFMISTFEKQSPGKIEELFEVMNIEALPKAEIRVLMKPHPPEIQKISEIPKAQERELVKHPPEPLEHEPETVEPEQPSDSESERMTTKWTPECHPDEAEISSEEYTPKEVQRQPATRTDEREVHVTPQSEPSPPSKETEEMEVLGKDSKNEIGRWGEEYVLLSLREEKVKEYPDAAAKDIEEGFVLEKDGKTLVRILWLNKYNDTGLGHDLELMENDTKYYIEVKSTKTEERDWFDISKRQWLFMHEKGDRFFIHRVYGAGTRKPRVVKVRNPAKLWLEGRISAYPVRIQL